MSKMKKKARMKALLYILPFVLFFAGAWYLGGFLPSDWLDKVLMGTVQLLMLYVFYQRAYKKYVNINSGN